MRTQLNLLLAIKALQGFLLVMPIIVIYWQDLGLSLTEIFWLQVVFSVMIVVSEVPSGYLADRFGRVNVIRWGLALSAIAYFIYFTADGFWFFLFGEIVLAIGVSCVSGADVAFIYDTLKQYGKEKEGMRQNGRILATMQFSESLAALTTTGLALLLSPLRWFFILQALVPTIGLFLATRLREPRLHATSAAPRPLREIIRFAVREHHHLRSLQLFAASVGTGTLVMVWLVQPYWQHAGVPLELFGILWAGLNLTTVVGASLAHHLDRVISFRTLFLSFALAPFILYAGLFVSPLWFGLAIAPLFWLLRGLFQPTIEDYVNRVVESSERATMQSLTKLATRALFSITSPFIGWVADLYTLTTAFAAAALILGTLALLTGVMVLASMRRATRAY